MISPLPNSLITLTAWRISLRFDAPVDKSIGLFVLAIILKSGKFVISADATLKNLTSGLSSLTESIENGVDKNSILILSQYSLNTK